MRITPRVEWNARTPRSVTYAAWSKRTGVMFHYSDGPKSQSVRLIQDWHMDGRGWSDIGYNFLIHAVTGEIFEGRGWLAVGAHCLNFNTPNIGICFITRDAAGVQDVSEAARASGRWMYAEAQRRAGKPLVLLGHKDRGDTSCPGNEIYAWLRAGLPGGSTPPPTPDWERTAIMALDTLRKGSTGGDVRKSESLLAAAGYPPANSFNSAHVPDGNAGDGWLHSVRSFQSARKLVVDGVVGPATWTELLK